MRDLRNARRAPLNRSNPFRAALVIGCQKAGSSRCTRCSWRRSNSAQSHPARPEQGDALLRGRAPRGYAAPTTPRSRAVGSGFGERHTANGWFVDGSPDNFQNANVGGVPSRRRCRRRGSSSAARPDRARTRRGARTSRRGRPRATGAPSTWRCATSCATWRRCTADGEPRRRASPRTTSASRSTWRTASSRGTSPTRPRARSGRSAAVARRALRQGLAAARGPAAAGDGGAGAAAASSTRARLCRPQARCGAARTTAGCSSSRWRASPPTRWTTARTHPRLPRAAGRCGGAANPRARARLRHQGVVAQRPPALVARARGRRAGEGVLTELYRDEVRQLRAREVPVGRRKLALDRASGGTLRLSRRTRRRSARRVPLDS